MSELANTSLISDGNLLAYYKFDSGALTTDSSGNSRTLTNNNTVGETSSGKYGYATDHGDPNTNKNLSRAEDIWNNGAFSMVCWAKRANTTDNHTPLALTEADTDKQFFFWLSTTQMTARISRVGVGNDDVAANCTVDTDWHHYAVTLTTGAGGTMKIYQDGTELNSDSVTNASGTTGQGNAFGIGTLSAVGNWFEGYLDDVAFFNDVLTADEISTLSKTFVPRVFFI